MLRLSQNLNLDKQTTRNMALYLAESLTRPPHLSILARGVVGRAIGLVVRNGLPLRGRALLRHIGVHLGTAGGGSAQRHRAELRDGRISAGVVPRCASRRLASHTSATRTLRCGAHERVACKVPGALRTLLVRRILQWTEAQGRVHLLRVVKELFIRERQVRKALPGQQGVC